MTNAGDLRGDICLVLSGESLGGSYGLDPVLVVCEERVRKT